MAVGESFQFAPRDPDPEASYRWRIAESPAESTVSLGDDSVVEFVPDRPGRYVIAMEAPDGRHSVSVKVFPGEKSASGGSGTGASGRSGVSGRASGGERARGVSGGASGSGSGALGAESGGAGGRPRVQLFGRVEGEDLVVEAEPEPHPDDDRTRSDLDVEFLLDDRDDVDSEAVSVSGHSLRVPRGAVGDRLRVHGVSVADSYSVADAVAFSVDGESVSVDRPYDPPEWATEVTLYEIYVRGFVADDEAADSTFEAIEDRLDYLEELGVDCLWLTPVLENDHAPHGYNITDFFSIAEDLGDRESYASFVEAAHERGMAVLFDLVLNHSARQHPFFQEASGNPDSEYYDWYEWQDNGEPGTYFDWEYIANFDYTNLAVRRHLLDAVDEWVDLVDGFRCDMAWAVPRSFWQEVRDRVKAHDEEFLLLDETIPYIADFHEGMFDVHFDTTLYFTLRQIGTGHQSADALLDAVDQRAEVGFPDHAAFMLYQENHDETRYLVECGEGAAMAAAGALFTLPGIPMIYAGQELGQRGRRDPLAWEHAREELREHYERLVDLRDGRPALQYGGGFERVDYESDSEAVVAFRREAAEAYVVALNFDAEPATLRVEDDVEQTDVLTGESVAGADGIEVGSVVVLPARE